MNKIAAIFDQEIMTNHLKNGYFTDCYNKIYEHCRKETRYSLQNNTNITCNTSMTSEYYGMRVVMWNRIELKTMHAKFVTSQALLKELKSVPPIVT